MKRREKREEEERRKLEILGIKFYFYEAALNFGIKLILKRNDRSLKKFYQVDFS